MFASFDMCLADAGFDDAAFEQHERAELDGSLDEAQLDEQWAAIDVAFEQCEPILDQLSSELKAQLEAEDGDDSDIEDCDDHESQEELDNGEIDDVDDVDESDDIDGDDDVEDTGSTDD